MKLVYDVYVFHNGDLLIVPYEVRSIDEYVEHVRRADGCACEAIHADSASDRVRWMLELLPEHHKRRVYRCTGPGYAERYIFRVGRATELKILARLAGTTPEELLAKAFS